MVRRLFFNLECTQPSVSGKRHGGGIYGEIVLRRIVERGLPVTAFYNSTKWLNPEIESLGAVAENFRLIDRAGKNLQDVYKASEADAVFSPIYGDECGSLTSGRNISVVHGLRTIELNHDKYCTRYPGAKSVKERLRMAACRFAPEFMRRRYKKELHMAMQNDFIVVSEHTAAAVKVWFPEFKERHIDVFYSPSTVGEPLPASNSKAGNYLLMVNGNRWEKNILRAIEAMETLFDASYLDGINVKITGINNLKGLQYKFRHPERFEALGYVDDAELVKLYAGAYAFIYPTLNEGFGYPPLEAMNQGTPVAASAVCSIPEVCGDAVLYFNPLDVAEIANRLLQLTDDSVRARLAADGRERVALVKSRQDTDLDKLIDYIYR